MLLLQDEAELPRWWWLDLEDSHPIHAYDDNPGCPAYALVTNKSSLKGMCWLALVIPALKR